MSALLRLATLGVKRTVAAFPRASAGLVAVACNRQSLVVHNVPALLPLYSYNGTRGMKSTRDIRKNRKRDKGVRSFDFDDDENKPPLRSVEEAAAAIDTTLTPAQKIYVEMLKKQIKGGVNSPRSLYRDVPRPEEVKGVGNFMPKIADNAEALIDFALSKIPMRAGPRRTRSKARMTAKFKAKRFQDKRRKEETIAANIKKQAKQKKHRALCQQYREEAAVINAAKALKKMQQQQAAVTGAGAAAAAATK